MFLSFWGNIFTFFFHVLVLEDNVVMVNDEMYPISHSCQVTAIRLKKQLVRVSFIAHETIRFDAVVLKGYYQKLHLKH